VDEPEQRGTARTIHAGDVCLSVDLGTAYSKCATRRGPGLQNPVEFDPGCWVLTSDLAIVGHRVGLALRAADGTVIEMFKGKKPADDPRSYDAHEVKQYLGPLDWRCGSFSLKPFA